MLLPAIQYGEQKTVERRMNTVVTQLKRGADIVELMTRDGMLDLAEHPGMLMLGGIPSVGVPYFHCYMPWLPAWHALFKERTLSPTTPTPTEDEIFAASLRVPWGLVGLLAWNNQAWLFPRERHQPFLHAVLAAWDELDAVGPHYHGSALGRRLWSLPTGLHHVLANMGVPNHVLQAPLPAEGPRALLRYARAQS